MIEILLTLAMTSVKVGYELLVGVNTYNVPLAYNLSDLRLVSEFSMHFGGGLRGTATTGTAGYYGMIAKSRARAGGVLHETRRGLDCKD